MDVEGAEHEIFQNMDRKLLEEWGYLSVELHINKALQGYSLKGTQDLLEERFAAGHLRTMWIRMD
jgi:hypothetical protein